MLLNGPAVSILFSIFFVWIAVISIWILKVKKLFREITQGVTKQDLKSILESILKNSEIENKKIQEILKKIDQIEKASTLHVQKIGLVRFNPFSDTGGDQSFVIALLDGRDNGMVVSSLHSRDVTRIYAKPIENAKARKYELSKEEQEAIKKAKTRLPAGKVKKGET
jgi:hypothetical protein